ncbi:MAG: hypothetical protein WBN26_03910 [Muriicola sp.]
MSFLIIDTWVHSCKEWTREGPLLQIENSSALMRTASLHFRSASISELCFLPGNAKTHAYWRGFSD